MYRIGFYFFILSILCFSCKIEPDYLKEALRSAGDNRPELEKVLMHYKNKHEDGFQYDISEYLISNMPMFYSYDTAYLNFYRPALSDIDSLIKGSEKKYLNVRWDSLKQIYPLHRYVYGKIYPDIQSIKASYIIDNIDLAIETWKDNPYRDSISCEDFIEYVLPYRKKNGKAIENWRSFFHERHSNDLKEFYPQSIITFIDSLMFLYREYVHTTNIMSDFPYLTVGDLMRSNHSLCEERTWFNVLLLSSIGIPATIDYVPFWGNRHYGHTWNTIQYNGTFYAFEPFWDEDRWKYKQLYNNVYAEDWRGKFRLPKVYRFTYGIYREGPLFNRKVARYDIPDLFKITNLADVSNHYFATSDVKVRLTEPGNDPYSYLCVFNNNRWNPVQWAATKRRNAVFKDMGRDIVYLPAYYRNNTVIPASEPFLLKSDGSICTLAASESTETVILSQTSPELPSSLSYGRSLVGGFIQGSNRPDFIDAEILAKVSSPDHLSIVMDVRTSKSYRYVRFVFPDREVIPNRFGHNKLMAWGNIAELILYGESGYSLDGEAIYSQGLDNQNILWAFDNQHYTYMSSQFMDSIPLGKIVWVGLDFGVPTKISRVEILPTNEDVFLYRDAKYELFYWGKGKWNSLGVQSANESKLTFSSVPCNVLLLLKALDLPIKERPFIYENGRQVFL